jgi:hypothetical protein
VVLLKERSSEGRALAKFQVSDSDPPQVTSSEVREIFAGAAVAQTLALKEIASRRAAVKPSS